MNQPQAANGSYDYTKVPTADLPIEHHGSSSQEQDLALAEKAARKEGTNKVSTEVSLAVLALSAAYVGKIQVAPTSYPRISHGAQALISPATSPV